MYFEWQSHTHIVIIEITSSSSEDCGGVTSGVGSGGLSSRQKWCTWRRGRWKIFEFLIIIKEWVVEGDVFMAPCDGGVFIYSSGEQVFMANLVKINCFGQIQWRLATPTVLSMLDSNRPPSASQVKSLWNELQPPLVMQWYGYLHQCHLLMVLS